MPSKSRSNLGNQAPGDVPANGSRLGGLHNIAELARRSLDCSAAVVRVFDGAALDGALCAAALSADRPTAGDTPLDPCELSDPVAADDLGFRFYAGIPLRTRGGDTLGVLAAVDLEPRQLADGELETLNLLARVAAELAEAQSAGRQ